MTQPTTEVVRIDLRHIFEVDWRTHRWTHVRAEDISRPAPAVAEEEGDQWWSWRNYRGYACDGCAWADGDEDDSDEDEHAFVDEQWEHAQWPRRRWEQAARPAHPIHPIHEKGVFRANEKIDPAYWTDENSSNSICMVAAQRLGLLFADLNQRGFAIFTECGGRLPAVDAFRPNDIRVEVLARLCLVANTDRSCFFLGGGARRPCRPCFGGSGACVSVRDRVWARTGRWYKKRRLGSRKSLEEPRRNAAACSRFRT